MPDFSPRGAQKRTERDEPLEEGLVMHIREAFLPFNDPSPNTRASKRYLVQLIGEYLRDEMTLKRFFKELSGLTSPISSVPGDIYRWLVHLLIYSDKDPSHKLMNFLLENGVDENDLEYGSVKRLLSMYSNLSEESEKKRERPRHRRSVSKGLRNPPNKWAKEESQRLIQLVNDYGDKSWKKIAEHVGGGKTGAQCAQHWKRVLCPIIRKGSWDDEEELKLFRLVEKYGQSWKNIASEIGSRTDIQCRYQYFKSCMSREVAWSPQEDDLLMKKMNEDIKCENREVHWVEVARYMARGRLTKIPRTALECRTRHELLTSPPSTDVKSLSSSVNIVRDCPDLPVVLPPDLADIGTVPEISDDADDDDDFPNSPSDASSPSHSNSLLSALKGADNDIVRELVPTMIEA